MLKKYFIVTLIALFSIAAFADQSVDNLIAGYGTNKWPKYATVPPYHFGGTPALMPNLLSANQNASITINQQVKKISANALRITLKPNPQANALITRLSYLPGSDFSIACKAVGGIPCTPITDMNLAFDFNTLIGPLAYTSKVKGNLALNYIALITNLANPISVPDEKTITRDLNDSQKKAATQAYLIALRAYTANLSIVFNNFYHAAMIRDANLIQLPNNETIPGADGKPTNKVSQLQLQDYLANWRLRSPGWTKSVNEAVPVALQRKMVFMQAQELSQLQHLSRQIERLNLTMSALLAHSIKQDKIMPPLLRIGTGSSS